MRKVSILNHKGKHIVFVNLSHSTPVEVMEILQDAQKLITSMPRKSVIAMTDLTQARFDQTSVQVEKEYSAAITPFLKVSAVVGPDPLRKIFLQSITNTTHRHIEIFENQAEALDWLVSRE
jgi:hypothetical protein